MSGKTASPFRKAVNKSVSDLLKDSFFNFPSAVKVHFYAGITNGALMVLVRKDPA
jgi:hypothetical protein